MVKLIGISFKFFERSNKHKLLMDLINFREIALYYPLAIDPENNLYNEGQIRTQVFEDLCNFGYHYNISDKRDIFCLNIMDKLIGI